MPKVNYVISMSMVDILFISSREDGVINIMTVFWSFIYIVSVKYGTNTPKTSCDLILEYFYELEKSGMSHY